MKPTSLLTFDWQTHDRSMVRMGLALVVTVVAVTGMFIVFRVVSPESRRVDVRPQRVVLLNPNVPAERALIHHAMDRSFGMIPSSDISWAAPPGALKMPGFIPSYAQYEMRPKPLPTGRAANTRMRSFALDMDVLPALPKPPPRVVAPAVRAVLKPVVEGSLAARSLQDLKIRDVPLADTTRPRFQVAIGSRGQVILALPLSPSDDTEVNQKLHHVITQMHFAPAQAEVEWGQISFQWVKEGSPQ